MRSGGGSSSFLTRRSAAALTAMSGAPAKIPPSRLSSASTITFASGSVTVAYANTSVTKVHRFAVPKLISWDDDLLIVEIQVVSPPFILDFGKAYLDHPPDFDEQTMAEDEEHR